MGCEHLTVRILHEIAQRAVKHAGAPARQRRCVLIGVESAPGGLDADQAGRRRRGTPRTCRWRCCRRRRTRPPTDGSRPSRRLHLRARLVADHSLQPADKRRVRMRADGAADDVMGVADVGDPVADRLVGRVLERRRTAVDRHDLGAEQTHLVDVERLTAHVLAAHVDDATEAERGTRRGGGDAVLPCSGLRDDPALAHALREQHLAERVVELVCAGVEQVLPFEPDLRTRTRVAETARVRHRRRTAGELGEPAIELGGERPRRQRRRPSRLRALRAPGRASPARRHRRTRRSGRGVSRSSLARSPACAAAARAASTKASHRAPDPSRRGSVPAGSTRRHRRDALRRSRPRRRRARDRRRAGSRDGGRRRRPTRAGPGGRCLRAALQDRESRRASPACPAASRACSPRLASLHVDDRNDRNRARRHQAAVDDARAPGHRRAGSAMPPRRTQRRWARRRRRSGPHGLQRRA